MKKETARKISERTLIYFPIIHTPADMGALKESIQRITYRQMGREAWRRKVSTVDQFWTKLEEILNKLDLSHNTVRLYQDGLPVCGKEAEIVTDLAETGSRNHGLLLKLVEKGATIMGTESPEFLKEEYENVRRRVASENTAKPGRQG